MGSESFLKNESKRVPRHFPVTMGLIFRVLIRGKMVIPIHGGQKHFLIPGGQDYFLIQMKE